MKTLNEFVDKALAGLDIAEEEKKALQGIFIVNIYKAYLELLLSLKGSDLNFMRELNEFFEKNLLTLTDEEITFVEEAMDNEKERMLTMMMSKVKDNLTDEAIKKFDDNLKEFAPNDISKSKEISHDKASATTPVPAAA